MEILRVTPSNFGLWKIQICHLLEDTIQMNFPNFTTDGYSASKCDEIEGYLRDDKVMVYIAVSENKLLGWVWFHEIRRFETKRLHIAEIAVDSRFRGKGIGVRLLKVVESYAVERGYTEIDLFVTKSNLNAVRFYEKANYEPERYLMKKTVETEFVSENAGERKC